MLPRAILCLLFSIALVSAAAAETYELDDGTKLNGTIVDQTYDTIVLELEAPLTGIVHIPVEHLKKDEVNPGLFGTSFMEGWKREATLGFDGSEGNTVNASTRFALDLSYDDETSKRWSITHRYLWKSEDDDTTDHNAVFNLRRDWLIEESRWFYRAAYRWRWDEFKEWQHRISFATGPGYHILDRETLTLDGLIGPQITRDFGDVNEYRAEGVLGLELTWQLNEKISFTAANSFLPEFTDMGNFRNLSKAEWSIALLERPALSLRVGADNEYDKDPEGDDDNNDLNYYGAIGIGF